MGLEQSVTVWLLLVISIIKADVGFEALFRSVRQEVSDVPITFENPLPSWLKGTLIRNGLGAFENGNRRFLHAFDSFGKLSSFKFMEDGRVMFSSRFLGTNIFNDSINEDTISPYLMFQTVEPGFSDTEKLLSVFNGVDNTNVNIYTFGPAREHVALSDFWRVYHFDPLTFDVIEMVQAEIPGQPPLINGLPALSSAHPLTESGTQNQITYVTTINPFGPSSLIVCRITSAKQREAIATFPINDIPYMHSFGLTKDYAIIFMAPAFVDIPILLETFEPLKSIQWKSGTTTKLYVVNLKTGSSTIIETDPVFAMHFPNAFQADDETLSVDVVTYPNIDFFKTLQLDTLRHKTLRNTIPAELAQLRRYKINLKAETATYQEFPTTSGSEVANQIDMPVINENFRFKPYCYTYGMVLKSDGFTLSNMTMVKKNLCKPGEDRTWNEKNHYPSEPIFIARPGSTTEDDGTILSLILDGKTEKNYIALMDPKTLNIVNKAYLPINVPFTIHGQFYQNVGVRTESRAVPFGVSGASYTTNHRTALALSLALAFAIGTSTMGR